MTEEQNDYNNTNTLEASMEEDDLLLEENSAEFDSFGENIIEYELFDENSIESEVFDKTSSSCSLSSKNANLSKTVKQLSKKRRTNPIWTIIEETDDKNYCKIC
ncbi:11706_t:CDS:1 [Dentiscutata erythropus]|uniref:11706_t:CDS:1 n=1 Tax=Dentiscutata erythropus TaxID=1348616 RepID=A0A9N9HTZ6_9GLOM|nr:11706_t:CDS:1 [Dentiscutata erythropus]